LIVDPMHGSAAGGLPAWLAGGWRMDLAEPVKANP